MTRWPAAGDVELVARAERARVLAAVARDVRDLELAEDAVQEALEAALRTWPRRGVPDRPGAWLTIVARRAAYRALNERPVPLAYPAAVAGAAAAGGLAVAEPRLDGVVASVDTDSGASVDAQLELLFACCHPALALRDQVALTLRTVAGLTTEEIAAGFLLEPAALAQRLVRAQRRIRDSGIPFRVPEPERLAERLDGVLGVIYLVYTEAHTDVRVDLADEAVRLARLVATLLSSEPEALGLAALVLAHDARRAARVHPTRGTVPLAQQDRAAYDRARLDEAGRLLDRAIGLGRGGPYQVQAAIALLHGTAPSAEETDWSQIAALYDTLMRLSPGPAVALNRAAAIGSAHGAQAGLRALGEVAGLHRAPLLHVTRADLLERAGRSAEAAEAVRRALELLAPETREAQDLRARLLRLAV